MGVAKTTNSGADWKLVWKESDVAAKNVNDAWITERFGPRLGRESSKPYGSSTGRQSGVWYRPRKNHADD